MFPNFDECYIQRTFKHIINGKDVELEREQSALAENAVPSIFPCAPSYLTLSLPKRRKHRGIADSGAPLPKRTTNRGHAAGQ